MSNTRSSVQEYKCYCDCEWPSPCPGHKLYVELHGTSDTVSIVIDGKSALSLDEGAYYAMVAAIKELDKRNTETPLDKGK